MSLVSIPKLEELAEDPSKAASLPVDVVEALLGKNAIAQGVLMSRLLALRASGNSQAETGPDGDRLLNSREASAKLSLSEDHLYRHSTQFPFTVRVGRRLRFSEAGIARYIRQQMGR